MLIAQKTLNVLFRIVKKKQAVLGHVEILVFMYIYKGFLQINKVLMSKITKEGMQELFFMNGRDSSAGDPDYTTIHLYYYTLDTVYNVNFSRCIQLRLLYIPQYYPGVTGLAV